jgi:hypothetical protein
MIRFVIRTVAERGETPEAGSPASHHQPQDLEVQALVMDAHRRAGSSALIAPTVPLSRGVIGLELNPEAEPPDAMIRNWGGGVKVRRRRGLPQRRRWSRFDNRSNPGHGPVRAPFGMDSPSDPRSPGELTKTERQGAAICALISCIARKPAVSPTRRRTEAGGLRCTRPPVPWPPAHPGGWG